MHFMLAHAEANLQGRFASPPSTCLAVIHLCFSIMNAGTQDVAIASMAGVLQSQASCIREQIWP